MLEGMGAGHFIFIPAVLLVGIVLGWILGSRAARDAFAVELKRREARSRQGGQGSGRTGSSGSRDQQGGRGVPGGL